GRGGRARRGARPPLARAAADAEQGGRGERRVVSGERPSGLLPHAERDRSEDRPEQGLSRPPPRSDTGRPATVCGGLAYYGYMCQYPRLPARGVFEPGIGPLDPASICPREPLPMSLARPADSAAPAGFFSDR